MALVPVVSGFSRTDAGDYVRKVSVGGRTRSYIVHIPPSYDASKSHPLVLVFHGGGTNAESMVRVSGLGEQADAAGFVTVYPDGSGRFPRILTWNGGNCCGYAEENGIDDAAFVRELLRDIASFAQIDRKAIYATGLSNGGQMAYRLAVEMPDRIAAIGAGRREPGSRCLFRP